MAMSGCCKEAWTPAEPAKVLEDGAGLVSSFRPIVLCLQLLGFDIHWGGRQLTDNRLISLFYRFIWLLINLTVVGTLTEHVHNIVSSYKGSSFEINRGIISATAIVQIIATYGSLTLAAWQDGGQLAESLRRIQARMPISKGMLKKIRIVSIVASAVATILVREIQVAYCRGLGLIVL